MNYTGNVEYKTIKEKQFLTADSKNITDIVKKLNEQNIEFSARYDDTKMTITFHKSDFNKVNDVLNAVGQAENGNSPLTRSMIKLLHTTRSSMNCVK